MKKLFILTVSIFLLACQTSTEPEEEEQQPDNSEVVPNFSLDICSNGEGQWSLYDFYGAENSGENHVIYLDLFASWCNICADAAPETQEIYEDFKDQGLVVVGAGSDLNQPYSCGGWANAFSLTYPILNDQGSNSGPREMFEGSYPVSIVIGHDMKVVYKESGRHNDTAIRTAIETALENMKNAQ